MNLWALRLGVWLWLCLGLFLFLSSSAYATERDPAQVRAFRKMNACPAGPDAGSHRRCQGYVVDHIKPLCFGGKDDPKNMTYQVYAESLLKDEFEREACALARMHRQAMKKKMEGRSWKVMNGSKAKLP